MIINCHVRPELKEHLTLAEYLGHTHFIDRIEVIGRFTNIYWSKEFFKEVIKHITGEKLSTGKVLT